MTIRKMNHCSVMRIGMLFLIIANLALRFLHPTAKIPENVADGVKGLFYGLAIGTLLLSVRMKVTAGGDRGSGKCA